MSIFYSEMSPEFQNLVDSSGYEDNHCLFSWTGISLTSIPGNHPLINSDCVGWFTLYRQKAVDRLYLPPRPSSPPPGEDDKGIARRTRCKKFHVCSSYHFPAINSQSQPNQKPFTLTLVYLNMENGQEIKGHGDKNRHDGRGGSATHDIISEPKLTKISKTFYGGTRFPQLSDSLSVHVHFLNGKVVYARQSGQTIATGTILAKDTSYALMTFKNSQHIGQHKTYSPSCVVCSYCLVSIVGNKRINCAGCTQMRYCTQDCHDRAYAEFHMQECGAFEGLGLDLKKKCHQQLVLTLRAICRLGPQQAYEVYGTPVAATHVGEQSHIHCGMYKFCMPGVSNGKVDSTSMETVSKMGLAGNYNDLPNPELCNLAAIEANIIIRILEERILFFDDLCSGSKSKLEVFKTTMGGLAYNILLGLKEKTVMMTSRNKCTEHAWPGLGRLEHINGFGIFPTISMMTHSCYPNAFVVFEGRVAYVIAARPIIPEEEISISWFQPGTCPRPENKTRSDRMTLLKGSLMNVNKFCICELCRGMDIPFGDLNPTPLGFGCLSELCSTIGAQLSMPLQHVSGLTFRCWACGTRHNYDETKKKIQNILMEFERESEMFAYGDSYVSPDKTADAITTLYNAKARDSQLTYNLEDFYKKLVISQGVSIEFTPRF